MAGCVWVCVCVCVCVCVLFTGKMTTQDRDITSGLLTRNRQTATSGVLSSTLSNSSINSGTNIIINGLEVHDKAAVGAFKAFLESSNTLSVYASQMA